MTPRNVMIVLMGLMISLPLWSRENAPHDKELDHVYQTVIRDSQKKLSPATTQESLYLPSSVTQKRSRAPASIAAAASSPASEIRHAAMPWAADVSVGEGIFSLK